MRSVIGAAIALILFSSAGYGADWQHFMTGDQGNEWFYNAQSVSQGQGTVRVQTKEILSDSEKEKFIKDYPHITNIKNISYILDRWEINCSEKTSRPLSSFWYSAADADVFSEYYSHNKLKKIVPDSVLAELAAILCKEGEEGK